MHGIGAVEQRTHDGLGEIRVLTGGLPRNRLVRLPCTHTSGLSTNYLDALVALPQGWGGFSGSCLRPSLTFTAKRAPVRLAGSQSITGWLAVERWWSSTCQTALAQRAASRGRRTSVWNPNVHLRTRGRVSTRGIDATSTDAPKTRTPAPYVQSWIWPEGSW